MNNFFEWFFGGWRGGVVRENPLLEQSLEFAADVIRLQIFLVKNKKEFIISKQIIRSATSIGANINEANYAISSSDFISKMHIALKECAETEYWIKLLLKSVVFYKTHLTIKQLHIKNNPECLEVHRIC